MSAVGRHRLSTAWPLCQPRYGPSICASAAVSYNSWHTKLRLLQNLYMPVKNWVMRCWRGYLSGTRCKWFEYGLADAIATPPSSLASLTCRMVESFWCWLTQVVLEKRQLNGCLSLSKVLWFPSRLTPVTAANSMFAAFFVSSPRCIVATTRPWWGCECWPSLRVTNPAVWIRLYLWCVLWACSVVVSFVFFSCMCRRSSVLLPHGWMCWTGCVFNVIYSTSGNRKHIWSMKMPCSRNLQIVFFV